MRELQRFIEENRVEFTDLRHMFHQHPEIGFEEVATSDKVAELLNSWGYQVTRGFAKTGMVATLRVGEGGKTLGLRADMDALPMQENSGKAWTSLSEGKFHGCGHDGHTTTLLFAAKWFAHSRAFNGTLHLFFQPAEELLIGGKVMLDDGAFSQFPCDAIFALHNMPGLPEGSFNFRAGAMLASADTVQIEVTGVGGHGAIPEKAVDATLVACYIVIALQSIVSRNVTPFQPAVITVGSLISGMAANIINERALMKLSVRTLDPVVREQVLERISVVARAQAESFGARAEITHLHGSPVLVNDPEMTDVAIAVARELFDEKLIDPDAQPLMGSEDFAFMLEEQPRGSYFFVGAGEGAPVHNPHYDFNDAIMPPAVTFWARLVEKYLS